MIKNYDGDMMFKEMEPDDIKTQNLNVEYGKSSKIILSGVIIDWVAILFFLLSKYHRYAEKEGFLHRFRHSCTAKDPEHDNSESHRSNYEILS